MTDIELKAIMSARDLRTKLVDEGIINSDTKKLDYNVLSYMINMYEGHLSFNNNHVSYFQKKKDGTFDINISDDIAQEDKIITLLQGIAIRLFAFDNLSCYRIIRFRYYNFINDFKYRNKEDLLAIYLFAREFLMPRELFDDSIEDNIGDDNLCDYRKVAIDFNTSYQKVLARKEDFERE